MMRFSEIEKRDLLKAWVVISLAVAIAQLGGTTFILPLMVRVFVIYALTVGISLLAHEVLGHKFLAQRFGLFAEFRADDLLLLLALATSFLGFVFIIPGAVVISGITRIDTFGKVAAAGPVVNIILAFLFSALHRAGVSLTFPPVGIDLIALSYGINAWFALFNLIPFGLWDGAKVFAWDKRVWFILVLISAFLFLGVL